MEYSSYDMIWLVEMLTSGDDSHDSISRDPSRKLNIPDNVMDLMYFGRAAGEAVLPLSEGKPSSIDARCPNLSRLAAVVATREEFRFKMHGLAIETIARIVAALSSQEVAALWDGTTPYQDIIQMITGLSVMSIPRDIYLEATVGTMVNTLENFGELSPEAAKFAINLMDGAACDNLDCLYGLYMSVANDNAITFAGDIISNDEWKSRAIDMLAGIDFESEVCLTEEYEKIVEDLTELVLEESNPKNTAITTAWLAAIYRYTQHGPRIADHFGIEIGEVAIEDQEDKVASPASLAA